MLIRLALALVLPLAAAPDHAPDTRITKAEIHAYQLTMPKIRAWYKAQELAARRWEPGDDMKKDEDHAGDDPNLLYQHILKHPKLEGIAREAGLSAREFTVLAYAFVDAAIEAYAQKLNPKVKTESLSANIALLRANEAELTRLRASLGAAEKVRRARKDKLESTDDDPAN